ncbi:ECF transporter S component [Virgibacillus profundi]|uniref:ECF transporter S component n=1 Tax=Virgibacillus profundi TaxID=2024555 RepID=A0A2A2I9M8_9BACI|nr:ECF transporter S component [Virgibacillus profundi]PAV27984.1 ECF transporter S component [Virgibacillus profundi]PXY52162.1 ECF transporter S component [Virgibacillus profundi]
MNVRKMSLLALFIALSVIGAAIKVPAIIGSVALDAFPALLAAVFFGSGAGAVVGGLGHMMSALIGGMPLGPLHFIIALEMALLVSLFAALYKYGKKILAGTVFLIGNAFVAPLPFIFLFDFTYYIALVPSLLIGSALNTAIAFIAVPRLNPILKGTYHRGEVKG